MIIVIMGVSGAGKTTVGTLLAERLSWKFIDADDLHPAANVEKMRSGIALDDNDRNPWLERIRSVLLEAEASSTSLVLACSALKQRYRERLKVSSGVRFVFLSGADHLLQERLRARTGHFMPPELLHSQLADLEAPSDAIRVDVSETPEEIVAEIRDRLAV